jgi:hypothetical protein
MISERLFALRSLLLCTSAILTFSPAVSAATQVTSPCAAKGRPSVLRPRDEASRRPDFFEFRRRLQDAVAQKDTSAILNALHPSVKVAFDGAAGPTAFQQYHMNNPDENFWEDFGKVLAMGGAFTQPDMFTAPYVFSNWPDEFDSFECRAVIGTGVRLREHPSTNARTLAALSYSIV